MYHLPHYMVYKMDKGYFSNLQTYLTINLSKTIPNKIIFFNFLKSYSSLRRAGKLLLSITTDKQVLL